MRGARSRSTDATFDLNLAPILDIIVAIIPLLLLSVAFVQVKMIDTSVPQVVAEAAAKPDDNKVQTTVSLKVSRSTGFQFDVVREGKSTPTRVPNKDSKWDIDALHAAAFSIKEKNPEVFRVDLEPENDVDLNDLVKIMDTLRRSPASQKVAYVDPASGQKVETELMFPNVLFGNVIGN